MADKKDAATEAANKEAKEQPKPGIVAAKVAPIPQKSQAEKLTDWRKRHGYQR